MSTVVCYLFVVRVPERSVVCNQALCMVSGEASAILNDRHGFLSLWILASRTSHPPLANSVQGLCNHVFPFKIGHNSLGVVAAKRRLISKDRHGVISRRILAHKPSSFS